MEHEKNKYIVNVHDLTVAYNDQPVLWNIDLKLPSQNIIAVVGPNGAGKTTLIKSMLGLIKPICGSIDFAFDKNIKTKIGYVPQSGSVDWDFPATVLDVVLMGTYGKLGWLKRVSKKEKVSAFEVLEKVGMQEYVNRQISQLSGGQQQRVFLARALIQNADIYFMDEPFKGIDTKTQNIIFGILKELKQQGKTIVIVHHDLQTIKDYFDWIILINIKVIASGKVIEVFNEENIKRTYNIDGLFLDSRGING